MMLSIMVVGAGAAFADQKDIDTKHQEAVDACNALNIITGFANGKFMPNDTVTREQTAKMICVLLNGGNDPVLGSAVSSFSDVANDRWSCPYIESCVSQDIIVGVGGGKFAPAGKVTGSQLAKMLLVALGYSPDHQKYSGSAWEVNVNTDASARGFYVDLEDINPSDPLTREHAAQMIWNALNADEVEYKSVLTTENGQLTSKTTVTDRTDINNNKISLLRDKYGSMTENGVLTSVKFDSDDNTYTTVVNGLINNAGRVANLPFDAEKDYSDLMGQTVKVMYKFDSKANDYVLLGLYADKNNKVVSALADDVDNVKAGNTMTIDNKDYDVAGIQAIAPNGASFDRSAIQPYYNVDLVRNTKADPYDYIVVEPFSVAKITSLTSSKVTLAAKGGTTLAATSFDLAEDDVTLYDGAAKDDFVIVVDGKYTVSGNTEITKAEIIPGTIETTKGNITDIQVDGTWYNVVDPKPTGSALKLNDAYDFVVANTFVFDADKTKGNLSAENVVYIDKLGALTSGLADGVEAKVWFADSAKAQNIKITGLTLAVKDGNEYKTVTYDVITANTLSDTDATAVRTAATTAGTVALPGYLTTTWLTNTAKVTSDDEIYAPVASSLLENLIDKGYRLYTFSEDGGDYTVELIYDYNNDAINNIGSFDKFVGVTASSQIKDGKTSANDRFDNDAVIFVREKNDVKVVKGSDIANWNTLPITKLEGVADATKGVNYFSIGAFDTSNSIKSSAANYGYITSDVGNKVIDNNRYYSFTMWDGTNSVPVIVKQSVVQTPVKYGFISFNWKDEASGEADTDGFICKTASADGAAITALVPNESATFSYKQWYMDGSTKTFVDNTTIDFADDMKTIYVDTKAGEGLTGGELDVADDANASLKAINAVAFVVQDGTDYEIEAIFFDVNGMYTEKNGDPLAAGSSAPVALAKLKEANPLHNNFASASVNSSNKTGTAVRHSNT